MGKEYISYFGAKTTKCVDKFEERDENGHLIYSRMILKDFKNIPSYYSAYWRYGIALIIRRSKKRGSDITFSQLMKNKYYSSIYNKLDILFKTDGFFDNLLQEKYYYFNEEDYLYFKAQGSKDRRGFYKEWYNGMLMAEKNYGECSYHYEAIGIKVYRKF